MMAAETTSEAANANQRLLPMANTPLRTNSSLAPCGTYVAIFFDISCCVLPPSEVAGPRGTKYQGTIHDSTEACSPERAQMNARNTRLQTSTRRKMSPSLPCTPTAAAPMARFCGEIILPSTPPDPLPAALSNGGTPPMAPAGTGQEIRRGIGPAHRHAEPAQYRRDQRERASGPGHPRAQGDCLSGRVHHECQCQ